MHVCVIQESACQASWGDTETQTAVWGDGGPGQEERWGHVTKESRFTCCLCLGSEVSSGAPEFTETASGTWIQEPAIYFVLHHSLKLAVSIAPQPGFLFPLSFTNSLTPKLAGIQSLPLFLSPWCIMFNATDTLMTEVLSHLTVLPN